jgi:hypothetical protein
MKKLTVLKTYSREPFRYGINWLTVDLVYTVDGEEKFRNSNMVNADFLDAILEASRHPWVPEVATAIGIPEDEVRSVLAAKPMRYEIRDGHVIDNQ